MENSAQSDERIMAVVSIALRQSLTEREPYLRLACEDDESLYREAVELVKRQERLGSFMEHPLIDDHRRPFEIGEVISNRFEIIREIGEGGMAFVYEAFDRKRNQRIAVKAAKPGFHRLLSPELLGALQVRHRNVCLVNEIHTTQTSHGEIDFLTMELLDGETLSAQLGIRRKLPSDEALKIACQLSAGLAAAHESGVLHRDFKSSNIILCGGPDGVRAVITDFGLACGIEQIGEWGGTLRYMAPEVWQGKKTSRASDIYGLGVVLYEMVVGRTPFDHAVDCLSRSPAAPSTLAPGLGSQWDRTILQCLKPVPEDRPTDASLVLTRLQKRPARKLPWLILALMFLATIAIPPVRAWLRDLVWPRSNVRLAVLPLDRSSDTTVGGGVLQDVAARVGRLRTGKRTIIVIPPAEALSNQVQSPEQAKSALHATHALLTTIRRESDAIVANGSVIDLETHAHVRDFSGRYKSETIGSLPAALAGSVSLALRLSGPPQAETLSAAATVPYDRGLDLLRRDDESFAEALPLFDQAAQLDRRSPLPLVGLAEAQIQKFRATRDRTSLDDAQRSLASAESLSPDSAGVRLVAGQLNQTAGRYEKALEDYRRAHDLEPRNVEALLHIASIYNALDMNNEAIATYRQAIALEPGYYKPYRKMGEYYYFRSNYSEAAAQLRHAIERAPGLFDAYNELAAALSDLGQDDEAEKALLMSIRLRDTSDAQNSLGAIRAYQRRDKEAVVFYLRAITLDPNVYIYWLNLADSDRRLGHLREATIAYRKGLELALAELAQDPHDGLTRAYVGYFSARLGDSARAENEIRQARELFPSDTKVIRRAVLTYEALGKRAQAIEAVSGGPPALLHELDRQPDLTDFRKDLRFKQVVAKYTNGGR
jgi:serine/threonine protein kinase/tetratricopeptide (TPR) repeat protein